MRSESCSGPATTWRASLRALEVSPRSKSARTCSIREEMGSDCLAAFLGFAIFDAPDRLEKKAPRPAATQERERAGGASPARLEGRAGAHENGRGDSFDCDSWRRTDARRPQQTAGRDSSFNIGA